MKNEINLESVISKINILNKEITHYNNLRKELSGIPKFKRIFNKKKSKQLNSEIILTIKKINKLWNNFNQINIPEEIITKYGTWIQSAKDYFKAINKHGQLNLKIQSFGEKNFWQQFKNISALSKLFEEFKDLNNECLIKSKKYSEEVNKVNKELFGKIN